MLPILDSVGCYGDVLFGDLTASKLDVFPLEHGCNTRGATTKERITANTVGRGNQRNQVVHDDYGLDCFMAIVGFFPEAPLIFARLAAIEDFDVDR